ncbi:MAG: hypothetical protein EOO61_11740 [Hymenobacter sp.]|nr:MAG: hypothetical protein EOO61_11740 [Hymenobacter sp.]
MTNLVLLSYGNTKEYRRAVLAVLSFFSYQMIEEIALAVQIIIYTDTTEYFLQHLQGLPVKYVVFTREQFAEMMKPTGYRHRIKLVVVGEALSKHPKDNLLFFDSDTFFLQHPGPLLARIRPGVSIMHQVEFAFNDVADMVLPNRKTVRNFLTALEEHAFVTARGEEHFVGSQQCWNSGVLGLSPSVISYLPDVFQLTDYLYTNSHWHISEQIAFSLVLQTRDTLLPSDEYVYHYWEGSKKVVADALLEQALDQGFTSLPFAEKMATVKRLTAQLPTAITAYLAAHPEIGLKESAINAFNGDKYFTAYRAAFAYFLKKPADRKFIKDVLYHTKRRLALRK